MVVVTELLAVVAAAHQVSPAPSVTVIETPVIWTITIEPDGDGTRIIFDEVATGSSASALGQIAPAVDRVKDEAIARLTAAG